MIDSRLNRLWAREEAGLNGWVSIGSPFAAELLGTQGYDSITIDMQHGLADQAGLVAILQALHGSDTTPLVRIPALDFAAIGRALDAGAHGIICPMIETAEQARDFVRAMRYPPDGTRSFGPTRAAVAYGRSYASDANANVICIAMIETATGVRNVNEIAAVAGLSALYIGPSDLTMSLGDGRLAPGFDREELEMIAAITEIAEAAHTNGKRICLHCGSCAYAARALGSGFNLVTLPNDVNLLLDAARESIAQVRKRLDSGPGYLLSEWSSKRSVDIDQNI